MENNSTIKRNEYLIFATVWVKLEEVMWSEKKLISEEYMLNYSIYVTFMK